MTKKLALIATGGTGGHVFPALALGEELVDKGWDVRFIGAGLKRDYFLKKEAYIPIHSGRISFKGLFKLALGVVQSLYYLRKLKPDVLIGMGSYYTAPVLAAARFLKVPYVLHEGNAIPGKVNRLFAKKASLLAIQFPSASAFFYRKVEHALLPLRKELKHPTSRKEALEYYGLSPHKKTWLIMGGSQGARFLNQFFPKALGELKQNVSEFQVIHLCGDQDPKEDIAEEYRKNAIEACVKPFEDQMHYAWSLADLFIGRAGAGTICEMIHFHVPGLLIPYPYAADGHQSANALWVVEDLQAAYMLEQDMLDAETLVDVLDKLFQKSDTMQSNLKAYSDKIGKKASFAERINQQ